MPERSGTHGLFQILIGCRDEPDINLDRPRSANPFEFVFLQDTQQFGLKCGSEFTHFIQKHRSTIG